MAHRTSYATAPYGMADAAWCQFMGGLLAWGVRADVREAAQTVSWWALTRLWPSSHFPKRARERWAARATAAFRVSERELSELTGLSRQRVRTAVSRMVEDGFLVELSPATTRGEGRGSTAPTYAFSCHVVDGGESFSIESAGADGESSRVQTGWRL